MNHQYVVYSMTEQLPQKSRTVMMEALFWEMDAMMLVKLNQDGLVLVNLLFVK